MSAPGVSLPQQIRLDVIASSAARTVNLSYRVFADGRTAMFDFDDIEEG